MSRRLIPGALQEARVDRFPSLTWYLRNRPVLFSCHRTAHNVAGSARQGPHLQPGGDYSWVRERTRTLSVITQSNNQGEFSLRTRTTSTDTSCCQKLPHVLLSQSTSFVEYPLATYRGRTVNRGQINSIPFTVASSNPSRAILARLRA